MTLTKILVKLENHYPFIPLLRKKVIAKSPNPNKARVATSESLSIWVIIEIFDNIPTVQIESRTNAILLFKLPPSFGSLFSGLYKLKFDQPTLGSSWHAWDVELQYWPPGHGLSALGGATPPVAHAPNRVTNDNTNKSLFMFYFLLYFWKWSFSKVIPWLQVACQQLKIIKGVQSSLK